MTTTRHTTAAAASSAGTPSPLNRRVLLRAVSGAGAIAAFPALLGCATAPTKRSKGSGTSSEAVNAAPGTMVMVIRHGEKPAKSGGASGISLSGASDVHSLTERGWTRAADLVALFTPDRVRAGLPTPNVIYASGVGAGDGEGTRPRQTVGPLAAELGIPVDTTFSRGQEAALAQRAATQPGPALICWQHESIPAIAAAFAPATPAPPTVWPDDRYDVVWVFTATGNGWQFEQVLERLLPDDGDTGIP